MKCPHINLCQQQVVKGSLPICHGEYTLVKFTYAKCLKEHKLDAQGKIPVKQLKRAKEWASVIAKPSS